MYLKEKRDGRIKGRGCADGRPQRVYTDKSEASSPTASLAGVMLTAVLLMHLKGETWLPAISRELFCRSSYPMTKKRFTQCLMGEWQSYLP